MVKYSEEFKLKIVKEYLEGSLGSTRLAKKHGLGNPSVLQRWVRAYQVLGEEGLQKKAPTAYPVQFKLDVLHSWKRTGVSQQETALAFGLNNPSLIANWDRIFQREGVAGLEGKSKGRTPMPRKKNAKQPEKKNELSRETQLERENELLRLENAYLKKLKAFQENPDAFLEKHKQRWRSHSTKKDSN